MDDSKFEVTEMPGQVTKIRCKGCSRCARSQPWDVRTEKDIRHVFGCEFFGANTNADVEAVRTGRASVSSVMNRDGHE